MSDPIRISRSELGDPRVDEVLSQEAVFRGSWEPARDGGAGDEGRGVDVKAVAATAVFGLLGALLGWGLVEPYFDDDSESLLANLALIPAVATFAGGMIAACEGILSRSWGRAARGLAIGLGVGLAGGFVASIGAGILYGIGVAVYIGFLQVVSPRVIARFAENPQDMSQIPFTVLVAIMCARCMGWSLLGVSLGLGPGLAQRSRDLAMVGVLGGVLGGFLGGLAFDPLSVVFDGAEVSRAVGFGFVGSVTGLAIGLVEQLSKDAWLYMEEGPLAGKQFVLYKQPTTIGSSPKCDVYLFKDAEIVPRHALLHRVGAGHEVEAVAGASVLVNGRRVSRQRLEDGDQVRIGHAKMRYYVRRGRGGRA